MVLKTRFPECNRLVPSDWCATGAHAMMIERMYLPANKHYEAIGLHTVVLWFPEWHNDRDAYNDRELRLFASRFFQDFIHACEAELRLPVWRADYDPTFEHFNACMDRRARSVFDMRGTYIQAIVYGEGLANDMALAAGGVVTSFNRFADVLMLPNLTR